MEAEDNIARALPAVFAENLVPLISMHPAGEERSNPDEDCDTQWYASMLRMVRRRLRFLRRCALANRYLGRMFDERRAFSLRDGDTLFAHSFNKDRIDTNGADVEDFGQVVVCRAQIDGHGHTEGKNKRLGMAKAVANDLYLVVVWTS